ncbi:MAG: hypothetical protein JWQ66_799 [Mucilaginibacter sp.]|nr:hypothetical protein [Mucilaginibacter sp.]
MERSINYKLSRALAIVGIPMCGIALWVFIVSSLYLVGNLYVLLSKGIINEYFWGSAFLTSISAIFITIEAYYLRIGFLKISVKLEERFWLFSSLWFLIVFVSWFFLLFKGTHYEFGTNLSIALEFYWAFFLIGTISALIEIRKLKRSVHQQVSNG